MFPRGAEMMWVPVEKVVNRAGQAFTKEQHHFVRYLESGFCELERFYRAHQPKTALQYYFVKKDLPDYSGHALLVPPWKHPPPTEVRTPTRAPTLFGPLSNMEIRIEADRLDYLQKIVAKKGFIDGRVHQPGGQITGRLFVHENGDYRVVIGAGNHRTAVLVHHGWKLLPFHSVASSPPLNLRDLAQWPGVVDGRFAPETACAIFESFFRPPRETILHGW